MPLPTFDSSSNRTRVRLRTTTGGQAPTYVAAGAGASSNTPVSVPKPAGVAIGDLLVMMVVTNGTVITPATGFTAQTTEFTTNFVLCEVHTKIADGSEGANFSVSSDSGSINAICEAFRGVNATPMDAAAVDTHNTGATVTWPNITTVTNNALHYAAAFEQTAAAVFTTPTGYTARAAYNGVSWSMASFVKTITPAGLVTGVTSSDNAGSPVWAAASVAIRPS